MKAMITAVRKSHYAKIVEMSEADFLAYEQALDGNSAESASAEKQLNNKLDTADWQDDELLTVELDRA